MRANNTCKHDRALAVLPLVHLSLFLLLLLLENHLMILLPHALLSSYPYPGLLVEGHLLA